MRSFIITFSLFTSLLAQEEDPAFFKIEGEFTKTINQTIDAVRSETTELAIANAIKGYIIHDGIPENEISSIINCLRTKLVNVSVINESVIQTKMTITIKAYIAEVSVSDCI